MGEPIPPAVIGGDPPARSGHIRIEKSGRDITLLARDYVLVFDRARMLARLYLTHGRRRDAAAQPLYYHMSLLSAIDQVGRAEETERHGTGV